MEDVLDLYAEAYDPQRPVVCFDELPVQLLAEVNEPLPAEPGKPKRQDYEYERKGHCSLFIAFEPLTGQRQVTVRERRTNADFAQQMQQLVASYPEAELIRVVLDNLSTHTPAALYQTFAAEEARRLTQKLEFHYTPKHGSWLNMAEIEWSVLSRQALKGRLPEIAAVEDRINPWQAERNQRRATVNWCFSTTHARAKLARLYPH
ncbi:MAG: Mobile element protein [uncultured Chloroflexia bacterium]|uniref:Mobile element protein n=1 Tax=uncultured Chloroflexia bacterium TaxID=1672391 RepID=A0A6J4N2L8_9CHLR|nr:MAG: Mobile element protein [uncultured Chloroflexia bacterium]